MEDSGRGSEGSLTNVDKVTSMMKREASFFLGIQRLTDALEHLHTFLEGADAKSVEEVLRESVKSWLEETKEAAEVKGYMEEDCLVKFSQALQQRRVINFLSRAGRRFRKKNASRSNLAFDVQNGKASPLGLNEDGQIREEEATTRTSIVERRNQKLFYSFVDEYFDSAAKDVTAWLTGGSPARSVISLVGPDGTGKSTLARKVYKHKIVRDHFHCCVWVDVSRSYKIKDRLKVMLQQIFGAEQKDVEGLDGMRTMELIGTLRQFLEPKRYMFVFDDVFQEDFWHVIKQSLPDNDTGSRIIITTPSNKVVASCKESSFDHVHNLGPLSEAMSWDLFCSIAFQDEPECRCPSEFEQLSREIIQMCRRLPLLIGTMAGILSTKNKLVSEWQKLHHTFVVDLKSNFHPIGVLEVLGLSFNDLPAHLRPCFLYFSIFPEDSLIPKDKLLKLWIAESFVEEEIGKTLEEVAEEYLNELIHCDIVQSCQGFYGSEQFCRVHRLVDNIIRVKADEYKFSSMWDESNSSFNRQCSRLSIYNVHYIPQTIIDTYIRSVFLSDITMHNNVLVNLIGKCKFLTLLDFEYVPIEHIPEELGNLLHLKYLSLKNTKVRRLPKSVDKLYNLQTLDLRNSLLSELPIEINNLKNLRHLLASVYNNTSKNSIRGVQMKEGIGSLENLQTLMTVKAHQSSIGFIKELAKLQQLRKLDISGLTAEVGSALCFTIDEFVHLESLILQAKNKSELNVQTISSSLPLLRHLVLKGRLQKLPYWISGLQNLTTLCLSLSKLTSDPLMHLFPLPNLVSLWLFRAYDGEQLYFAEGGFQRLKLLVLQQLHGLNAVEIEEGALPQLEELRIGSSPLLNEVPFGIQHLRNLKVLKNYDMPSEFVLSMQQEGGSDYWKVKHISSIVFCYRVQGRNYKLYKLDDSDLLDHLQGLATNRDAVQLHQDEFEWSFCVSDDEEDDEGDDDDNFGSSSLLSAQSFVLQKNTMQSSFSSGFYSDDLEE